MTCSDGVYLSISLQHFQTTKTYTAYQGTSRVCTTRLPSLLAMRTNGRCCRKPNFLKAMACSGVNVAANQVDYSLFLLYLHCYEEATTVLKQVISSECQNPVAENAYGDSERNTTEDDNLVNEINRHRNVSIFSVVFGYYLLANIYYDIGRHREEETLLPDFHRLCDMTDLVVLSHVVVQRS